MNPDAISAIIAVLGGTGQEGKGLAYRWAKAGCPIIIGSRSSEKAESTATELNEILGKKTVIGMENGDAAKAADILVLTVPYSAHASTLETIRDATEGMAVRFGAEDFPLDAMALDFYGDELGNVLEHPRCGMLIDLGHMHMRLSASPYFRGMTMLDYVKRLPLNIIELHVHDNNGRKDQHAPLGQGTLPFGDAAEAFRSIGFDGVSTIEICPGLHGEEPAASRPLIPASFRMWRELLTGEDR